MKLITLIFALLLTGCSVTKEPGAYGAIAADTGTTAMGLAQGATEVNPLGWAVLPLSIAMVEHAKTLPPEDGIPIVHAVTATKWGAAASNALLLLGLGPTGLVVGVIVGGLIWQDGLSEREYYAICADWIKTGQAQKCLPFQP